MAVDRNDVEHTVKQILANGTPDWVRFPRDYKAMADDWAKECQQNLHEDSVAYQVDDQDIEADPTERRVNPMRAAEFMKRLRQEGLTCFSHSSPANDGTASLFVLIPDEKGGEFQPITSIQVPIMWEWGTLRIDPKTNLPSGFRDIGWRSAVRCLIMKGALTEQRAHEIFGKPREALVSRRYRRLLYKHRNKGLNQ